MFDNKKPVANPVYKQWHSSLANLKVCTSATAHTQNVMLN